jgi:hypothetical protein
MELRMVSRLVIIGATVMALTACASKPYDARTGTNTGAGYGNSVAPPEAPLGASGANDGCAGDEPADALHQNRPGGSDHSTLRCHTKGY